MVSSGAKRNVIPAKAGTSQNVQVISCTFPSCVRIEIVVIETSFDQKDFSAIDFYSETLGVGNTMSDFV
jgi:hypothetical protein